MTHICEQVVEDLKYLENIGLSVFRLNMLHHSKTKEETFESAIKYFSKNQDLRENNTAYANRLRLVAGEYKEHKGRLSKLIDQALEKYP